MIWILKKHFMAASFSNDRKVRQVFDSFLVVCEGETEVNYLKGYKQTLSREKQRTLKIEPVKAVGTDCLSIVNEAIARLKAAKRENIPFKEVWAFFDDDNQPEIVNAFSKAKANGIRIAFSSICLELWFLLHFEYTSRQFMDSDEVTSLLKNHWSDYRKPAFDSWARLKANTLTAKTNSLKLRKATCSSTDLECHNPFTNIDLMLESIGFNHNIKSEI